MKKHNESKSIKGIRRSKGKILCKVISFTMIFVMLFCISAYAYEEEEFAQTITVMDQNNQTQSINVNVRYVEEQIEERNVIVKEFKIEEEFYILLKAIGIRYESQIISYYGIARYETSNSDGEYSAGIQEECVISNITEEEWTEVDLQSISLITTEVTLDGENVTEVVPTNVDEVMEHITLIENYGQQIKTRTNYTDSIIIESKVPAYEGFMGNARGLFDMIFESIQSIFNWLVSPNVIVFFGLGIILSLTTIGILIARRLFWGR